MKINKKTANRKKSLSRLMAIQIFYQYNFLAKEKNITEIKQDLIENYIIDCDEEVSSYRDKIDEDFLNNLITGISLNNNLDNEIQPFLKDGFTLEKTDQVLQQILKLGTFELKFMLDIPYKVVIDEYVDITAAFFDEKRTTFVNGILESLAKKFRDS